MNLTFCASVIGTLGILGIIIRTSKGGDDTEARKNFWDREAQANFVRKKSLDNLDYITIPDEILNMKPGNTNESIESSLIKLNQLKDKKIVNLTGITNTDLKLKYGTANITVLSEYDSNYTDMVVLLQELANELYELDEKSLAIQVLEFAVSTNSDVSKTYYLLSKLYKEAGTPEKCEYLLIRAGNLNSLMRDSIVRNLKASGQ